jgi:hypothetical protein
MWSHYGDGHRSVAIEFDTNLLARAVLEQQKRQGGVILDIDNVLFEIKYQDELPEIGCEHIFQYVMNINKNHSEEFLEQTELAKRLRLMFSLKSMVWKIEKEWRLMWHNDETTLKFPRLELLDDTITAVYLGVRSPLTGDYMNDDFIFETKRHFPRAEIFKVKKRKGKFALDFERIAVPVN